MLPAFPNSCAHRLIGNEVSRDVLDKHDVLTVDVSGPDLSRLSLQ